MSAVCGKVQDQGVTDITEVAQARPEVHKDTFHEDDEANESDLRDEEVPPNRHCQCRYAKGCGSESTPGTGWEVTTPA